MQPSWLHPSSRREISPAPLAEAPGEGDQGAMRAAFAEANDPVLEDYCWRLSQEPPLRVVQDAGPTFGTLRETVTQVQQWHPLTKLGLVKGTRQGRQRALNWIIQQDNLDNWEIEPALLETIARQRRARRWKWSTTLRGMAAMQGALKHYGVELNTPNWRLAVRGVAIKSREERPRQALPATTAMVQVVIDTATPRVAAAVALAWMTCARPGCISQLQPEDVALNHDGMIAVTFRRGKAVRSRGPYTVHTKLPQNWRALIRSQLEQQNPFRTKPREIREALRVAEPRLEQRSLRRGALQTLARSGVPEEDLLHFSGHTTAAMLRRYLEWGQVNNDRARRQAVHAGNLHPGL